MSKIYKPICLVLLTALVCSFGNAYASNEILKEEASLSQQRVKVSGTISDPAGPVPGATVAVKGTSRAVLTDVNGRYSIEATRGEIIVVSFIGLRTQEIAFDGQPSLDVVMEEDLQKIDEVVITAMGMSREKKALGYAMTEIKGDEIAKSGVANPLTALQGRVAGVQLDAGTGGPQSANRILIRGTSSLDANNQPIFVIDGVIIDNSVTDNPEWGATMDFGNEINNLNSDDFETVSVLKGAAATALYGSRAANGVIVITTKKGRKAEGLGISLSHTMTWDKVYAIPDLQYQFGPGLNPVWPVTSDGQENRSASSYSHFGPEYDGGKYSRSGTEYTYAANPDNWKKMYQVGTYMNTNVAIQGGDEKGGFRLSYSRLGSKGTTMNNDYNRNSFSIKANRKISERLEAEAGVFWTKSHTLNPAWQGGGSSPMYDFMYQVGTDYDTSYWLSDDHYMSPNKDGYNDKDPYGYSSTIWKYLKNNYTQDEDNIRANANLNIKITDWLDLKLTGDFNKTFTTKEDKVLANASSKFDGAEYKVRQTRRDQYKLAAFLNFHKQFNDLGVNAFAAIEQWDTRTSYNFSQTRSGLITPGKFTISNSVGTPSVESRIDTDRKRINSVFGQVSLDWKSQIFLDLTARNDWSSSLMNPDGSGDVGFFYPAANASWIITQTFRDQLPQFISFAKIRASYAIVGGDTDPYMTGKGFYKINNDYPSYKNPLTNSNSTNYEFDGSEQPPVGLKPRMLHSIEFGADIKFFDNRLGFDFAWYKTNAVNQILKIDQAKESGFQSQWVNEGNIQNMGLELTVTGTPIRTRDWTWNLTANLTRNTNKILELGYDKSGNALTLYRLEGGGFDMNAYATLDGSYGDIYTAYVYLRNDAGEKLLNANGSWIRKGEQTKVGSLLPDFLGGVVSDLRYKDFSFSFTVDSRFGGEIASTNFNYGMNRGKLASSLYGRTKELGGLPRVMTREDGSKITVNDGMIPDGVFRPGTKLKDATGAEILVEGWTFQKAVDEGLIQPISAFNYYNNKYSWGYGIREEGVKEVNWISLREIRLGWNVPKKWSNKVLMQNINVGVVARNLCYLYNSLPDNIHPEALPSNRSTSFVANGGPAYSRTFGFNVNLTF